MCRPLNHRRSHYHSTFYPRTDFHFWFGVCEIALNRTRQSPSTSFLTIHNHLPIHSLLLRKVVNWSKNKQCKNWRKPSSGMLHRVALVRSDVSEDGISSIIRATRIGELGTTLAVTSNRRTLRRNTSKLTQCVRFEVFTAVTVFWDMTSCGLVITDVSKELIASIIRVEKISKPGTTSC
jgi:hypothetical protein